MIRRMPSPTMWAARWATSGVSSTIAQTSRKRRISRSSSAGTAASSGGTASPSAAYTAGRFAPRSPSSGHELAERVVGPARRRKHLRHAVDREPLGLDRPQHVVGRDAALAQRMGQPDPRHVDGDESALGILHEHADGDQLVDLRGLHVRLARELRLRQVARLRSHVPIISCIRVAAMRSLGPWQT